MKPSHCAISAMLSCSICTAANLAGDPVPDPPTCRSLGVHWIVQGDDNASARVTVSYRRVGTPIWQEGAPLFRVAKGAQRHDKWGLEVPSDAWLFAGSIFLLDANTSYQLRLNLIDSESKTFERTLEAHTNAEPVAAANDPLRNVVAEPGPPGDGTAAMPFRGLRAAQKSAVPGDVMLLHPGRYEGVFVVNRSGAAGKPIIWRGLVKSGKGPVIDGMQPGDRLNGAAIDASSVHDVWFEQLEIANAWTLLRANESSNIVVRRCHLHDGICGVVASRNDNTNVRNFFISDNLIEGTMPWPVTREQWRELPESRGIWITGSGHDIGFNRIRHMKDGIDLDESPSCYAIDIHNNDISEMFDDGAALDGSERNTRCFLNRFADVRQGISFQPVFGGPAYAFRNVMYNVQADPFKLRNGANGVLMIHNTIVKHGSPMVLASREPVSHFYSRNNLFVGTDGMAIDITAPMVGCDFDFDGFGGFSGPVFMQWNGERFAAGADARARGPFYRHLVIVDPAAVFAIGTQAPANDQGVNDAKGIDLRLKPGSAAIGAGESLSGFNHGSDESPPDLGAFQHDDSLPQYGPRPEPTSQVASPPG